MSRDHNSPSFRFESLEAKKMFAADLAIAADIADQPVESAFVSQPDANSINIEHDASSSGRRTLGLIQMGADPNCATGEREKGAKITDRELTKIDVWEHAYAADQASAASIDGKHIDGDEMNSRASYDHYFMGEFTGLEASNSITLDVEPNDTIQNLAAVDVVHQSGFRIEHDTNPFLPIAQESGGGLRGEGSWLHMPDYPNEGT